VFIDAERFTGHLTYGECVIPGETDQVFLLSAHICHPSLANDNCSRIAPLTLLAKELLARQGLRHPCRLVSAPGTTGAPAWLPRNADARGRTERAPVVACVRDGGRPTSKRSRRANAFLDRAMASALRELAPQAVILDFSP